MTFSKRTKIAGRRGFLSRLGRDRAGNVFAMTAAAVIPMIGVVGGAIDASRMYLTRSRLQAACDAAVLAGRKAMDDTTYDQEAQNRANAMFNFNFQDSDFQTSGTDFSAQADAEGKLDATAETTVPLTMMKMFGFTQNEISVSCSADIQIPNIDIVFVLDVTGSMGYDLNGETRMDALHRAAKNFYTTLQTQMAQNGQNAGRVRYGFVPFSQAVNGKDLFKVSPNQNGDLGELSMSHLADTMAVESRVANFESTGSSDDWMNDPDSGVTKYDQIYDEDVSDSTKPYVATTSDGTKISNNDCDNYSSNKSFSIDVSPTKYVYLYPRTSWPGGAGIGNSTLYVPEGSTVAQTSEPTSGNYFWKITFERLSDDWEDNNGSKTSKYRTCTRRVNWEKYVKGVPQFVFKNWTYKTVEFDVSAFKTGTAVSYVRPWYDEDGDGNRDWWEYNDNDDFDDYVAPSAGPYDPVQLAATADAGDLNVESMVWNGCIEERDTVAVSSFAPIPSNAYDLNWLLGGTSAQTRWRPIMDKVTYNRGQKGEVTSTSTISSASQACPTARMRNLNEMDQNAFNAYIDSLTPVGGTYLDAGLIWGLRLISPQGMFAARNLVGPNGGQISRHVIFMTDGQMSPTPSSITSYGLEVVSQRVTGNTGVDAKTLHLRRFQALCDGQRGSVSLWAIGFATSIEGALTSCADPGRVFQADNAADLEAAFTAIARDIADLRLVQ